MRLTYAQLAQAHKLKCNQVAALTELCDSLTREVAALRRMMADFAEATRARNYLVRQMTKEGRQS